MERYVIKHRAGKFNTMGKHSDHVSYGIKDGGGSTARYFQCCPWSEQDLRDMEEDRLLREAIAEKEKQQQG
jgi:hypothetical protein